MDPAANNPLNNAKIVWITAHPSVTNNEIVPSFGPLELSGNPGNGQTTLSRRRRKNPCLEKKGR